MNTSSNNNRLIYNYIKLYLDFEKRFFSELLIYCGNMKIQRIENKRQREICSARQESSKGTIPPIVSAEMPYP